MDMTMGIIIMVVAVLEIHMDRKAEVAIKPTRIRPGLTPISINSFRAMRRCRLQRSMAGVIMLLFNTVKVMITNILELKC